MATRLIASPSRFILDLIREKGALTRQQMFELSSRDVFPSKARLKKAVDFLSKRHRIIVSLFSTML